MGMPPSSLGRSHESAILLARYLQQRFPSENKRQFHSPLFTVIHCEEVVEWLLQNTVEIGDYPLE